MPDVRFVLGLTPWAIALTMSVLCWTLWHRALPVCPIAPAVIATAATSSETTEAARSKMTITVPASDKSSTIVVESAETVTTQIETSTKLAAATARRPQWSLGVAARFRPSLSGGVGSPVAYSADIAARVADSPLFGVVGAEREQDNKRWSVSLGVRYEF
jgi:hypothetical protein